MSLASQTQKSPAKIQLVKATIADKEFLENLINLFIYELSPYYPFEMSNNGTWQTKVNAEKYLKEQDRLAWLIKLDTEIIGFALINSCVHDSDSKYNLAEFFILAKFQKRGLGSRAAHMLWDLNPGAWEIMTLTNHVNGKIFWERTIKSYLCNDNYKQKIINVTFDEVIPERHIYIFDSSNKLS